VSIRRLQSVSAVLIALTAICIVTLVALLAGSARSAVARSARASDVLSVVTIKRGMFASWECVRTELGVERAAYDDPAIGATMIPIGAAHRKCEGAIRQVLAGLEQRAGVYPTPDTRALLARYARYQANWQRLMGWLQSPAAERTHARDLEWVGAVDGLTGEMDRVSKQLTNELAGADPFISAMLQINDILWNLRGDAGVLRRVLGDSMKGRGASPAQMIQIDHLGGRMDARWAMVSAQMHAGLIPERLSRTLAASGRLYFHGYGAWRGRMIERLRAGEKPVLSRAELLAASGPAINSITAASMEALDMTSARAWDVAADARAHLRNAILKMIASILLAAWAGYYVLRRVVFPLEKITQAMDAVAHGTVIATIPFETRHDEIGGLARSLRLFRDGVIARQAMELQLVRDRAAKEIAENASRTRAEFFASMSHELRTPLNAILGFSEIISCGLYGPCDARYQGYARSIHEAGAHLLALVNDVLDLSKADAGKLALRPEPVVLGELLRGTARLMLQKAREAGLTLDVEIAEEMTLWADPLRLKQVIFNLLSNAIKFTDRGGCVTLSLVRDPRGAILIGVRDTGIGIPAERLPELFEPFHQIDNVYTRSHDGTGLGLAIVKKIVGLHDGTVDITSAPGEGTLVLARLPASRLWNGQEVQAAAS
jgi:signal transduction histidine kinase